LPPDHELTTPLSESTESAASESSEPFARPDALPATDDALPPALPSCGPPPPEVVIPRAEHPISRKNIAPEALRVLTRLNQCGYKAYLVGGAVRDLFLGKSPKDYDIATNARPSRLKKLFRNCRIIGRRFRIAHVYFPNGMVLEVSTFRRSATEDLEEEGGDTGRRRPAIVRAESGIILRDNAYGTPEEDARRRDLTINGLFYDLETFSVLDYVGGVRDLREGVIRMINDPDLSFREDPVRMIRALRHAARTHFRIEERTLEAIYRNRQDIVQANPSRLLEEVLKDLKSGTAGPFFASLVQTHLLDSLLPRLAAQLRATGPDHPFWRRMSALDARTGAGASFSNPVLLAILLHTAIFADPALWTGEGPTPPDVWKHVAANLRESTGALRISRRDSERVLQIVLAFRRLRRELPRGRIPHSVLDKVYLPEALDFLEIDLASQGLPTEVVEEWRSRARQRPARDEVVGVAAEGGEPADAFEGEPRRRRRRRRGGRRRRRHTGER
jgi:poly(A) polymerase